MSDVEWEVKFGAPNRVTAKPEAGVELIVAHKPHAHRSWGARLVIHGETAWERAGFKLSSDAKGVCEERYRSWRKRQQ